MFNKIKDNKKLSAHQEQKLNSSQSSEQSKKLDSKDLILRDQTLAFIQNISLFIKSLNTKNIGSVDREFSEIRAALKKLINVINNFEFGKSSQLEIQEKMNYLEEMMLRLIQEMNGKCLEKVINVSLGMARTANELFHVITSTNELNFSS